MRRVGRWRSRSLGSYRCYLVRVVSKSVGILGWIVRAGATATATGCDFMEIGACGVACFGANTKVRFNDSAMHIHVKEVEINDDD